MAGLKGLPYTRKVAPVLLISCVVIGAARAQQPPPRFRGGVDIVQIDVAVLDSQRHPVSSLAASDFTVVEDGKAQPIIAFEELSAPDPDGSLVEWMRETAPDVRTNSADGVRVFVLVLDDASLGTSAGSLQAFDTMRKVALAFVDRMGPLDQASVVLTANNDSAQDFTSDRAALRRVIERTKEVSLPPYIQPIYSAATVRRVAEALVDVSHRRKALVYIGAGLRLSVDGNLFFSAMGSSDGGMGDAQRRQVQETEDAITQAQRANVSIYTVNPRGLEAFTDEDARTTGNVIDDALWAVANQTGGFAITNTNTFRDKVAQIFRETGSYYLLGFRSAYTDGKLHRISVKVDRPGLTVRTRNGYYAPAPEKPKKQASPLFKALGGILPNPDMYLREATAAFATPDRKSAGLAVALGLTLPTPKERLNETVDLVAGVYTREGKPVATRRQTAHVVLRPSDEADAKLEILTRLDLKPGQYNLRFAVQDATQGKTGSVYTDVDIPNFEKDRLSLSGVAIGVAPGLTAAGKEALAGLVPQPPTTQRVFAKDEQVRAFLRVYQGGSKPLVPITMRTTIRDARDGSVFGSSDVLDPSRFDASRAADFPVTLPTATLPPGPYLLTIEAAADEKTILRRDVRFSMR